MSVIRLNIKVNEFISVQIVEEDAQTAVMKASFWNAIPGKCAFCEYPTILTYRNPGGGRVEYHGIRCTNPTKPHELDFGSSRDGHGLFVKDVREWRECPPFKEGK